MLASLSVGILLKRWFNRNRTTALYSLESKSILATRPTSTPVSMSGVEVGRVAKIDFDSNEYKAVVLLRLNQRFNKIPTDSDASIYTQGLLGGKFIGLTAGGADTYLTDKG